MALDAYALTTVAKAKHYLRLVDSDLQVPALRIYNSSTDATAATVEVTDINIRLIVTDGANADDTTLTFADTNKDTLAELVTAIRALAKGWVVTRYGPSDVASTDLTPIAVTACLLDANAQVLLMVDNYRIERLIDAVFAAIETECDYKFLTRAYAEWYDGSGGTELILNQKPVTAVSLLAIGTRGVLQVKNASGDATYATVTVTSTKVTLTITGGANDGSDNVDFVTYTTVAAVATQINTLSAKGWSATAIAAYSHMKSTELREAPALFCLDRLVMLRVPGLPVTDFDVYQDRGVLYYSGGFPEGTRNVRVKCTAGYATVPYDLEEIVWGILSDNYHKTKRDPGLKAEKLGDYSWTAKDVVISEAMADKLALWRKMA